MIFRSYKCQNKNFGQAEALNFEGLLSIKKLWIAMIFRYVVGL
jgi:hypothetical protein